MRETLTKVREFGFMENKIEMFRFPLILGLLMGAIGLALLSVPFWPGAIGTADPVPFTLCFVLFSTVPLIFFVFVLKYRIKITSEQMTFGTFVIRTIRLDDIADAYVKTGKSPELIISMNSGEKIAFSGWLSDFDVLSERIRGRNHKNLGSPVKTQKPERERR
jgi:hypothetical protein